MTNKQIFSKELDKQLMIAWGAGLFEGEGSFCFHKDKPRGIQITSTDRDILEKMIDIFGGKIYNDTRRDQKEHWKDAFVWRLPLRESLEFFSKVEPFLGKRRLQRGKEFMKGIEEVKSLRDKKSEAVLERFAKIFELRSEGLTHKKIAEIVGVDRTHVTKILNGA